MRQVELADHDFHVHAELVTAAQDLDHAPARQGGGTRVVGNFDVHNQLVEVAGTLPVPQARDRRYRRASLGFPAELAVAAERRPVRSLAAQSFGR